MSSQLIRQDLVPIGVGYVLLMTVLAVGLLLQRRGSADRADSRKPSRPGRGWLALAKQVAGTVIGGYLLLMAIVVLYYYGVARVGGQFLYSAFTGCALLLGLSLPLFAGASWLKERRRQRAEADSGTAAPPATGN